MSDFKVSRSADQLETMLNQTLANMHQHQKNSNYVQAENHRLTSEQLRKDLQARRVFQMEQRQNHEHSELQHAQEEELKSFNGLCDRKLSDYEQEGEKLTKDMEAKQQMEQQALRNQMQKQLSFKVKESSQFLNLKKMEQHMAKQKLYTQAHKVQARLAQLQKAEKEAWLNARNTKIETALNTLRAKQATELAALQKKIKTGLDEQLKERRREEERIMQKYGNIAKQLRSTHDKQILAFRGQFRSKGGQGSPLLLSKSKLLSSTK